MESARTPLLPGSITVGDVIDEKYRVERVLGRGGMGVVVAANHVGLKQAVAIKFLLPKAAGEPTLALRLLREARAAAALKGEHVARVFDVDTLPDGSPYIVMEYLEGRTLANLIEIRGALSPEAAVDWALQVCEALAEAHALGIVHRDLKPANLFLAERPGGRQSLRVLDFGISKALDGERGDSTYTNTDSHALIGSPPYVSPEQLVSPREVDARTDIWSLGVVLYECLTARRPFGGETVAQLWDSILREPAPPLGRLDRPITPELERVVLRCLEKKAGARYGDVRKLARALAPFGTERARASLEVVEGLALPVARPLDDPSAAAKGAEETLVESDASLTEEPMMRSSARPRGRSSGERLALPALAVLAILAIAGAVFLLGSSSAPVETPTSATQQVPVQPPEPSPPSKASAPASVGLTQPPSPSPSVAREPAPPTAPILPRTAGIGAPRPKAKTNVEVAPAEAKRSEPPALPAPAVQKPEVNEEAVYTDRK